MLIRFLKRRHHKYYHHRPFHLIADIVFAVIIILLIITFFVIINWQPKPAVSFELKALDEAMTSGSVSGFEIDYQALKNTTQNSVNFNLPSNFKIEKVEPADIYSENSGMVTLKDLKSREKGKIKIYGRVLGALNSEQVITAIFNCNECGAGVLNPLKYRINKSVLEADLSLPVQIYQQVDFAGKLKLKNNGLEDLENIKIKFNDNWRLNKSDYNLKGNEIMVAKIGAGATIDVNFSAATSLETPQAGMSLDYYLVVNGADLWQGQIGKSLAIKTPNFKFEVNPDKLTANASDAINYSVNFHNQEEYPINKVKLSIFSGSDSFVLKNIILKDSPDQVDFKNGIINFKKPLPPGESGQFNLSVRYERQKITANAELFLDLLVEYEVEGQVLKYHTFSNRTKVISTVKVKSGAYYYTASGDQLGVGPLPPSVDMATKYWVFWEVENTGNELDSFSFMADLPKDVIWTDNKSLLSGSLNQGEISGRVVWSLENVPAMPGTEKYKVGFEVGIIPTTEDVGKILALLKNVRYTAHDKFCDRTISGNLKDLNTNLVDDVLAGGQGVVVVE
jgi:hypothetical protein